MKQNGYFLIKRTKSITLYLWGETEEELLPAFKPGMEIVPYYKDENSDFEFIKLGDIFVKIS